jgi:hypothetical protein
MTYLSQTDDYEALICLEQVDSMLFLFVILFELHAILAANYC